MSLEQTCIDKGMRMTEQRRVIARVLECRPDWSRLRTDAGRGWVRKSALWGIALRADQSQTSPALAPCRQPVGP